MHLDHLPHDGAGCGGSGKGCWMRVLQAADHGATGSVLPIPLGGFLTAEGTTKERRSLRG